MKKFTVTIHVDNAAFEDDNMDYEIARILWRLAVDVQECGADRPIALKDINGNSVGYAELISE